MACQPLCPKHVWPPSKESSYCCKSNISPSKSPRSKDTKVQFSIFLKPAFKVFLDFTILNRRRLNCSCSIDSGRDLCCYITQGFKFRALNKLGSSFLHCVDRFTYFYLPHYVTAFNSCHGREIRIRIILNCNNEML